MAFVHANKQSTALAQAITTPSHEALATAVATAPELAGAQSPFSFLTSSISRDIMQSLCPAEPPAAV